MATFAGAVERNAPLSNYIGQWWNNVKGETANQDFSAQEAQKQRDWEEYMSNTAYQRQIKDMQAAGLNPAALYDGGAGGGATTPSGKAASAGGSNGSIFNILGQIMSSAAQMKNANTNELREIDTNKHLTEHEKNYLENKIKQNEYYSAKAIEANARGSYYKNKDKNSGWKSSDRKYTKKDFENVFDNIDTIEI